MLPPQDLHAKARCGQAQRRYLPTNYGYVSRHPSSMPHNKTRQYTRIQATARDMPFGTHGRRRKEPRLLRDKESPRRSLEKISHACRKHRHTQHNPCIASREPILFYPFPYLLFTLAATNTLTFCLSDFFKPMKNMTKEQEMTETVPVTSRQIQPSSSCLYTR